jgi:uncharacterized protein YqeY
MLKKKIEDDVKLAMKAKEQHRLTTIRGLLSEIKREEIDSRTETTDDRVITIVQREIKKRRDALEFARNAARAELIEQNEAEIAILQGYLGEQLSESELKDLIQDLVKQGNDSLGKIMGALNKDYKGRFDGRVASELAKSSLTS